MDAISIAILVESLGNAVKYVKSVNGDWRKVGGSIEVHNSQQYLKIQEISKSFQLLYRFSVYRR